MIRFANIEDVPRIMNFIDIYWCKGHIMSRNRRLFDFQHQWDQETAFVISETNREITGILGYIPYGRSDRDITLAIWKTIKTNETMLGIHIFNFLRENADAHTISAPGINPKTIPTYKFLGMHTGKMKHWYRLYQFSNYKIAKVIDCDIPVPLKTDGIEICRIENFRQAQEDFGLADCLDRDKQLKKNMNFIERRYFNHPVYQYIKYGVVLDTEKLFIILRIQHYNGVNIMRVIDCIGDHRLLQYFTLEMDDLLLKYNCEYVDCYESGIEELFFLNGGWKLVEDSGNIIPDYFAPFERRNIDIYYMSDIEDVIIFKGDGDMDRPN